MAKLLTAAEIRQILDEFNETNDWSLFDDVDETQQVEFLYPHRIKLPDASSSILNLWHNRVNILRNKPVEITDTDRLNWIVENTDWEPPGYNGCPVGRQDMRWRTEIPNLIEAVDAEIRKGVRNAKDG